MAAQGECGGKNGAFRPPGHIAQDCAHLVFPFQGRYTAQVSSTNDHESFMRLALAEAAYGRTLNEVPIGAVVVADGKVVGAGCNSPISATDPTAHAEINALRKAASAMENYRLTGATVYVTVEPCLMCVGAMIHARVGLVVFGAPEPRSGALVSAARAHETPGLNHQLTVIGGVLEGECREVMQEFFKERRE